MNRNYSSISNVWKCAVAIVVAMLHIPSVISPALVRLPHAVFFKKGHSEHSVYNAFGMKSQKFISAFHEQCFLSTVCVCVCTFQ